MYKIYALIGEAGSGKDTIVKKVLQEEPSQFHEIVSCTTRPPREHEINGKHYHFYSEEEFADKVIAGDLIEATTFNDWFYGTSYDSLSTKKINIGVFNPSGVETMMSIPDIDLTIFYIYAKDKLRLIRQLNRESNPDCLEIMRRYRTDLIDFEILEFDYTILHNESMADLQDAVNTICLMPKGQR